MKKNLPEKPGRSRQGVWGQTVHYDAKGHKTGETWPTAYGSVSYDEKGHRTGTGWNTPTGTQVHYDSSGHKTGESFRAPSGTTIHYDAKGHRTGESFTSPLGNTRHIGSVPPDTGYTRRRDPDAPPPPPRTGRGKGPAGNPDWYENFRFWCIIGLLVFILLVVLFNTFG